MQQDDFRALLNAPRASGSTSRYAESNFGSRRPGPGRSTSSQDSLSLAPRSHGAKRGPNSNKTSSTSDLSSTPRLSVGTGPRLGVDKMLDILRETNPDMTEEQLRQLAGEGGPRGLDLNYIAQAKKQEEERRNAQADSALDDMLNSQPPAPATADAPKKRSRDEILKSLREKNTDISPAAPAKPSKFRRVGEQSKPDPSMAPKEMPKKKKSKKRKIESAVTHAATGPQEKPAQPIEVPQAPASNADSTFAGAEKQFEEEEEDVDIFAGEAEYSGLSGSDSDEEAPSKSAQRNDAMDQPVKKNATWFDDDENEEAEAIAAPEIHRPAPKDEQQTSGDQADSDEEFSQQRSEIRAMLEADKAAERDEKRKERKLKYREKAGLGNREFGMEVEGSSRKKEKKLTDKDKLNRDYQQLQSRLQNQEQSTS